MKEFRRPSGQGAGRGGFDKRAGYGNHKGDHNSGERREVKHQAVCSECNKTCEVPFRPNGSKPVYCKDCFGMKKGAPGPNNDRFAKREDRAPMAAPSPAKEVGVTELKAEMRLMQSKLDRILHALETAKVSAEKAAPKAPEAKKPAVKEAPLKKEIKKAAPAKKAAGKPAAKPAAKKKK